MPLTYEQWVNDPANRGQINTIKSNLRLGDIEGMVYGDTGKASKNIFDDGTIYEWSLSGDALEQAKQKTASERAYSDYYSGQLREGNITGETNPYGKQLKALLMNPAKEMGKNPFFKWQLQQGEDAVNRAAAANGQLGSGNRMTALSDYAQKQTGNQFFTLAELYKSLKQQSAENYKSMYGLDNQKYGVDAQSATAANQLGLEKDKFGWQQELVTNADSLARQGWADAKEQNLMAQYGGLTSRGWGDKVGQLRDLADSVGINTPQGQAYARQAAEAYAKSQSAPLFYRSV